MSRLLNICLPARALVRCVLIVASIWGGAHAGDMTAEDLLELNELSPEQRQALMKGEIVTIGEGQDEATSSLLSTGLTMWVDEPVTTAIEALVPHHQDEGGERVLTIPESGMLPEFNLSPEMASEVERILMFAKGRDINLSAAELQAVQKLELSAPVGAAEAARFVSVFRTLMQERLNSYRQQGVDGIAPYVRGDDKQQLVGDSLAAVTGRTVETLRQFFPEFCAALEGFPDKDSANHQFLLIQDTWDDRPQVILGHRLLEVTSEHALFMHREFFVSQGYDAMQFIVIMVPYQHGTLIALSTDVVTDAVAGFGSPVLHFVGRRKVKSAAEKRLHKIRQAIQAVAAASTAATTPAVSP